MGQVAGMLGVQPAFLRRLDAEDVVQPARSAGGQRRYSRHEIHTVEKVVGLADEGLTLAGIRRLLVLEASVRDLQRQLSARENVSPDESPKP
ncbi:MAG: MerR family transcriptional regulator [Acidimicrobiales bacterium]